MLEFYKNQRQSEMPSADTPPKPEGPKDYVRANKDRNAG
jgi:hypothetical protein